jgi:hypothetical protein
MKLAFGDIVVVDKYLIGVVLKCWLPIYKDKTPTYDIYVCNYNCIRIYKESDIDRYLVRHKELDDEEMEYQHNAICNL